MGKKLLILLACFIAAILIVVFIPSFLTPQNISTSFVQNKEGMFDQQILNVQETPQTIHRLYANGEYVGTVTDMTKFNDHLKDVYHEKYETLFPGSACHLGRDVYLTEEKSYFTYSNEDDAILQYLDQNSYYTLESTAITFSDTNGEYAEIYVSDEKMYDAAMNQYISFFIDPKVLAALQNGNVEPTLSSYGSQDVSMTIAQNITKSKKNAAPDEIKTSQEEILQYLEYGNHTDKEYYTVQEYDTVAGVGSKNYGLSAKQLMNINRDQLTSEDQILSAGMKLCVTYFESPIDIIVSREKLQKEDIYFSTVTREDKDLVKNTQQVVQSGMNGSRNALYVEKWVNGVLTGGSLKSSVDTKQPVNEVIAVGTKQESNIGTGSYRYPVENPKLTCSFSCYYNHNGIDIADAYNPWGDVYAADNGTVIESDYGSVNGNYVMIDHNNGYISYYGHMREPSELKVGDVVQKGQVIGHIGMTGMATGPHVHFYIKHDNQIMDACKVSGFPSCEDIGG
jgi:murein DD-endopeptidase MepM/ murein hydrolase activator NlpD